MKIDLQIPNRPDVIIWNGYPNYPHNGKTYQFATWQLSLEKFLEKYDENNTIVILANSILDEQFIRAVVIPN